MSPGPVFPAGTFPFNNPDLKKGNTEHIQQLKSKWRLDLLEDYLLSP
jgi:hypothetical protein